MVGGKRWNEISKYWEPDCVGHGGDIKQGFRDIQSMHVSVYALAYFEYWRVGVFLVLPWLIGRTVIFMAISAVVGLLEVLDWAWSCQANPTGPGLSFVLEWMHLGQGFVQQQPCSPALLHVCISGFRNFTTAVLQEISHNTALKVNGTFWSCNCGLRRVFVLFFLILR